MKSLIQTVKGARDFYPEEKAVHSWLYRTIHDVSEQFGYQEYDGPFLERIDLYAAKSGEELVKEQAFVFPDRGGELITLRPELTPSLARMVAQRQNELVLPLRWWSFGPFWRYERPQKGRSREFFQWNIDLMGADTPEADAELVGVAATFFKRVGLSPRDVRIHVNNRRMMDQALQNAGIRPDQKQAVFALIDRRDKLSPAAWEAYALESGLSVEQLDALKALLGNRDLWRSSDEMTRFFAAMEAMGLADYIEFNPQVIRGLLYYTGTVFEAYDANREFRAVLGGGRYDNLVGDVGGEHLSGVGFAMGDMVVTLVMRKFGCIPALPASPAPVLVTVFDQERMLTSFGVAGELRRAGLNVNCYPEAAKLQKQLKFADRMGIRLVVIIGPDEAEQGVMTIKDLASRTQETVAREQAAEKIRQMLAAVATP